MSLEKSSILSVSETYVYGCLAHEWGFSRERYRLPCDTGELAGSSFRQSSHMQYVM